MTTRRLHQTLVWHDRWTCSCLGPDVPDGVARMSTMDAERAAGNHVAAHPTTHELVRPKARLR